MLSLHKLPSRLFVMPKIGPCRTVYVLVRFDRVACSFPRPMIISLALVASLVSASCLPDPGGDIRTFDMRLLACLPACVLGFHTCICICTYIHTLSRTGKYPHSGILHLAFGSPSLAPRKPLPRNPVKGRKQPREPGPGTCLHAFVYT